jgi:hypothetical protein
MQLPHQLRVLGAAHDVDLLAGIVEPPTAIVCVIVCSETSAV